MAEEQIQLQLGETSKSIPKGYSSYCKLIKPDQKTIVLNEQKVTPNALTNVLTWCAFATQNPEYTKLFKPLTMVPMNDWQKKFMQMERDLLFELTVAACYFDNAQLLDSCCRALTLLRARKSITDADLRKRFSKEDSRISENVYKYVHIHAMTLQGPKTTAWIIPSTGEIIGGDDNNQT